MNNVISNMQMKQNAGIGSSFAGILLLLISFSALSQAPTVNTPTVTSITTTGATLGGTVSGTLTHRGTRWSSTSPVGTNNELEEASVAAGAFTQARAGMPSATKIFFVAYARNAAPEGTTSEASFFTEPTQLASGDLTANATSPTTITLTFPAADSWKGTGATAGYVIYRKAGSAPSLGALADGAAPPADGTGDKITTIIDGTATTFNDTGLTAATDYHYTIVPFVWDNVTATTYNYNLASPQSGNDFTFALDPSGHATTPPFTVAAATSTSINLTFNSITTSGITNAQGYILLIKSSAIVAADLATLNDGAAPNGFGLFKAIINSTALGTYSDVTGLSPNTTYHYAIIPFNRGATDATYNYLTTTGFPTGSAATPGISATITPIAGGTAPVLASTLLSAGTSLRVLSGFSVISDGTQTISAINFNYTGYTSQFTNEYIYRSATAGTIGSPILSDNTPDGNFDDWTTVANPDKTIDSTPTYYYLVVDVANSVVSSTGSVTINPTEVNIGVASGSVNTFAINRSFTFQTSQLSDIILTGGTTNPINYIAFVANSINDDQSNSVSLADYKIRDGGAANDADNKGMSVTSIEIQITNAGNLRQIALFDDVANTEITGTEQIVSGSGTLNITFTPTTPISITDGGFFDINVRGTFKGTVTDNQSIQISIVSATASSSSLSGFSPIGTWASTLTSNGGNIIDVVASQLEFDQNPPATAINTNFGVTLRAIDANDNLDLGYTGKIDLTITGGSGTLSGGAQSLSPNLVAGQFTWTQLMISQAGTYSLRGRDDAYTGNPFNQPNIGNATASVVITSSPSSITQPAALNLCYGGNFQTLGNIVIAETDQAGFSASGTFSLSLPSGFIFDQTFTSAPTAGGSGMSISSLTYPSNNVVEFTITLSGPAAGSSNSMTIAGLRIRHLHPGGSNPSPSNGFITRLGGTATLAGVGAGATLGSVNAALGSPTPAGLKFTVEKLNSNDVTIDPEETRFSVNSNPVKLVGSPSGAAEMEFIGSGVTFISGAYRFNPQSLSPGSYNITYRHRAAGGSNCEFQITKQFVVYTTNIDGLDAQYCNNSAATGILSAQSYIDTFYSGAIFLRFVYWNTPGGRLTNGVLSAGAPAGQVTLANQVNSTLDAAKIFDPKLPEYQPVYLATGNIYGKVGIWIGFEIIYNGFTFTIWNLIEVRPSNAASFTIVKYTFCDDELPVDLIGNPLNSTNINNDKFELAQPQVINPITSSSTDPVVWKFDPSKVDNVAIGAPQEREIIYTYRDPSTGCVSTSEPKKVKVFKKPAPPIPADIISPKGSDVLVCQLETIPEFAAAPQQFITYQWYSDIGLNDLLGTGLSFAPPVDNKFVSQRNFYVTKTNGSCESQGRNLTVTVRQLPIINFTWSNPCLEDAGGTQFEAIEQSIPPITDLTYEWNFALNNTLTHEALPTPGVSPLIKYTNTGKDIAQLIAVTTSGCKDTVRKPIYIVPKFQNPITKDNTYFQEFNTDNNEWITGGTNSSWEWGAFQIKGKEGAATRGKGWETGLTGTNNKNEQSWVLSRCFNLTQISKPVISLDIFSDTPESVNGAVLQFNVNGNIENDANWITLGQVNKGINWYDLQGISYSPGNQASTDVGWSGNSASRQGKYTSWETAIFRLDTIFNYPARSNVTFRIAFASGPTQSDGFAFDNVFIGERTRVVLLENFTNNSAPNAGTHNNTYRTIGTAAEVVKVQYHTPFPANDPVNALNPQANNAHTAFYGITQAPTARLDGIFRSGTTLSTWLPGLYDDRVLTPSPIELNVTATKVATDVIIKTTITNKLNQTLSLKGAHIFTTIVEKNVTTPDLLAGSGNSQFAFVARQMLPSPTGLIIPDDLDAGNSYVAPDIKWTLNTGDAIVVAIQRVDGTKEVYQAHVVLTPPIPDLVTGIEHIAEYIQLYPNPANDSFVIELPNKTDGKLSVHMIDQVGRLVHESAIETGEQTKTIDTHDLAGGIYIVQIGAGNKRVVRKKVMIVHKQ